MNNFFLLFEQSFYFIHQIKMKLEGNKICKTNTFSFENCEDSFLISTHMMILYLLEIVFSFLKKEGKNFLGFPLT